MVMDVEHSNPDPGTQVLSYCKNDPDLVHNQLWMKHPAGEDTFYLVSKLGPDCKLTLQVIIIYCLYSSPHQLNHYCSNLLCGFLPGACAHKLVILVPKKFVRNNSYWPRFKNPFQHLNNETTMW